MKALRFRGWEFRPALWSSMLALVMVAATIALGSWQTRRAEEKLARQHQLDARAAGAVLSLPPLRIDAAQYEHARVAVRGAFVPKHTMLLDNRVLRGAVGYQVLTPLKIAGGEIHVIVNRGWIAAGPRREDLPEVITPAGELALEGIAVVPPARYYELGRDTAVGPVVQNLSLQRIAERTGLTIQPIILQQTSGFRDGLARIWERPAGRVNTHRAYALQWYSLAVLAVFLYVAYNVKRTPA